MYIRWLYLNPVTPKHYRYHKKAPLQYEEENDEFDSDESSYVQMKRSASHRRRFMEPDECYCNCEVCYIRSVEPCCGEYCVYCSSQHMGNPVPEPMGNPVPMPMSNPVPMPMGNPYGSPVGDQKVVFVPFPYPIIVPEETTLSSTATREITTKTTTSSISTTEPSTATTEQIGSRLRANDLEKEMARHRKLMQLNPAVTRHRPEWVPKYGIVTIPDYLAAKLMAQLTEIRALKSKTSGGSG